MNGKPWSRWTWLVAVVAVVGTCKPNPHESTGGPTVQVIDDYFSPATIQAGIGDSVRWHWQGFNPHDVVFEDGIGNSAVIYTGEHYRVFATIGNYRYRCTQHSTDFTTGQVGVVQVR